MESRSGQDFPQLSRPAMGTTQPPVQWVLGPFTVAWSWPPIVSSTKDKDTVAPYLYFPSRALTPCAKVNITSYDCSNVTIHSFQLTDYQTHQAHAAPSSYPLLMASTEVCCLSKRELQAVRDGLKASKHQLMFPMHYSYQHKNFWGKKKYIWKTMTQK